MGRGYTSRDAPVLTWRRNGLWTGGDGATVPCWDLMLSFTLSPAVCMFCCRQQAGLTCFLLMPTCIAALL